MVSRPTWGTTLRFTASAAISRTVQRARPDGDGVHTMAMIRCSSDSLNSRAAPGRGFSYKALAKPPSWYRLPIWRTALGVKLTLPATCRDDFPFPSRRSVCARLITRTDSTPDRNISSNRSPSLAVSSNVNFFLLPMRPVNHRSNQNKIGQ